MSKRAIVLLLLLSFTLARAEAPPGLKAVGLARQTMGSAPYMVSGVLGGKGFPGGTASGFVFSRTGPKDFCLVWINAERVRLMRCEGGAWRDVASAALAKGVLGKAALWRMVWSPKAVTVVQAGRPVLVWKGSMPGAGRVGVGYSTDAAKPNKVSVGPVTQAGLADNFQATDGKLSAWTPASGRWRADAVQDPLLKRDGHPPKASRYRGSDGQPAVTLTGPDFWGDYVAGVTVQLVKGAPAGLVFGYHDERNYGYLTVRAGEKGGEAALGAVVDGTDRVLARKPLPVRLGPWYRLRAENGVETTRAYVGHIPIGTGRPAGPVFGKAGLSVTDQGDAIFDDFRIEPITQEALAAPERRRATLLRTGFSKLRIPGERKSEMHDVVGDILRLEPTGGWQVRETEGNPALTPAAKGRQAVWFHREIRGDASVALRASVGAGAEVGLVISASEGSSGYGLKVAQGKAELLREGKPVASKPLVLTDKAVPVRLARVGAQVRAQIGDTFLSYEDRAPLDGGRTGLWSGAPLSCT